MVKMINATTGGDMWVAEDRVMEYKALGCRLAPDGTHVFAEKISDLTSKLKNDVDDAEKKPAKKTSKVVKKTR